MTDVSVASFEEMEPIYDGLALRARATLGVSASGMQVMTLPRNWNGYPTTSTTPARGTQTKERRSIAEILLRSSDCVDETWTRA